MLEDHTRAHQHEENMVVAAADTAVRIDMVVGTDVTITEETITVVVVTATVAHHLLTADVARLHPTVEEDHPPHTAGGGRHHLIHVGTKTS